MERILTASQMREADKFTIETLGIPEVELIDRAGSAVADEIIKRFKGGRVLVCVGVGNNGKDGLVAAKILSSNHGFNVTVLDVKESDLIIFNKKFDIIVDCIFGTGLNRTVEGKYKDAIEKINQSGAFVISCDIPSGINGNNGRVMGVAVRANLTIAIQELKVGNFLNEAIDYCGEVVIKDIGISVWQENFIKRFTVDALSNYFLEKPRFSNKGTFGKCALIGGSDKYSGSMLLSASALTAFKMGVGYVNILVPKSLFPLYVGKVPECILTSVNDADGEMLFDEKALSSILNYQSVSIGMGMGDSIVTYDVIKYLLNNYGGILVIDADGLNALSKFGSEILKNKKCKVVLTPHVGEFSRLSGYDKVNILENTIEIAKDFARHNEVVLLLKNAVSVITNGGEVFVNTSGCAGMAKAGSGDVLSGIVAGLTARQNDNLVETIAASSYLFGLVGEQAKKEQNDFTMTASDLIHAIPVVINRFI